MATVLIAFLFKISSLAHSKYTDFSPNKNTSQYLITSSDSHILISPNALAIETELLDLPKVSRNKFQDYERNIWRIHSQIKIR